MNLHKIKDISSKSGLNIAALAKTVGISEVGIHQSIRTGSMKVEILERICIELNVSPETFFDKAPKSNNVTFTNPSMGILYTIYSELEKSDQHKEAFEKYKKTLPMLALLMQ